jgi:hypothetical protein
MSEPMDHAAGAQWLVVAHVDGEFAGCRPSDSGAGESTTTSSDMRVIARCAREKAPLIDSLALLARRGSCGTTVADAPGRLPREETR